MLHVYLAQFLHVTFEMWHSNLKCMFGVSLNSIFFHYINYFFWDINQASKVTNPTTANFQNGQQGGHFENYSRISRIWSDAILNQGEHENFYNHLSNILVFYYKILLIHYFTDKINNCCKVVILLRSPYKPLQGCVLII